MRALAFEMQGTSLRRRRNPLTPCRGPIYSPTVVLKRGGGLFISEAPLYPCFPVEGIVRLDKKLGRRSLQVPFNYRKKSWLVVEVEG